LRAGTSQDAISRIERGRESPTFERLQSLLGAMGEEAVLQPQAVDAPLSRQELARSRTLTSHERLLESASWNLLATTLEIAGADARRARHPSTRSAWR